MSFVRSRTSKTSIVSTTNSTLSSGVQEAKTRLKSKPPTVPLNVSKTEIKIQVATTTTIPSKEDLDDIVNNLSTIVQRSQKVLTPIKSSDVSINVRRTTSLYITNRRNSSKPVVKQSNSHHETLIESNLDMSRLNAQRHSLRNLEKFAGIKCALPSGTSTVPNTFKGLEKHTTPTHPKQMNTSTILTDNPVTPKLKNEKAKSPWRLRFEKILNQQELTPLSPLNESIAFKQAQKSSLNKENRTPSFRFSARRTSKIHSLPKTK